MTKRVGKSQTKRPEKHRPDDASRAKVRALAMEDFSQATIARLIGVSEAELREHYAKDLEEGPEDIAAQLALRALQEALSGRDSVGARMIAGRLARRREKRAASVARQEEAAKPGERPLQAGNVVTAEGELVAHATATWRLNLGDERWQAEVEERSRAAGEEGPISYYKRLEREHEAWKAERTDANGVIWLKPGEPGKPLERLKN